MTSLFNYQMLNVSLSRETSALNIQILKLSPTKGHLAQLENIVDELLQLLDWTSGFIEIDSLCIKGIHNFTLLSTHKEIVSKESLVNFFHKLIDLIYSMPYLSQSIIFDFEKKASNIGIDLSTAADLRISHTDCMLEFNHLSLGITPLIQLLSKSQQVQTLKNAFYLSKSLKSQELLENSFLCSTYEKFETSEHLLKKVKEQSSIARIQTKQLFFGKILEDLEGLINKEKALIKAILSSGDLQRYLQDQDPKSFIKSRDFAKSVSQARI